MKRFLTFEKRMAGTTGNVVLVRVLAVVVAVLLTVIFLFCVGKTPSEVGDILSSMFIQTFFSGYGLLDVLVKAIPLIITAIGISLAFKMKLWNIGGEGQIAMGAFASAGVAMLFPNLTGWLLIPLMAVAAIVAGAVWAGLAGAPKAYLGVNETITTLMLNYVALKWLQYLITGPWRDPANKGFPIAPQISENAQFPAIPGTDLHLGLLIAVTLAVVYFFALSRSRWGYEIRVVGESPRAAEYAGINVRRNMLLALMLSGAVAGLAGMSEVSGLSHRLETSISGNYGYTAIIIAWLARLNPWGIIAMSIFMSALLVGGKYAQTAGISDAISVMIQGVILFCVLGFDIITQYKITFHFGKEAK
jgi:general nucleoside transport system permease protein